MQSCKESSVGHNYGSDLLRVLSSLNILALHTLGRGGILKHLLKQSTNYYLCWFMETCAYSGVNTYGLISGYVGSSGRSIVKYVRYFELWLRACIYNFVFTCIQLIIYRRPHYYALLKLSFQPVSINKYWYFTAYTGLFLFKPILNAGIRSLEKKHLRIHLVLTFFVFSVMESYSGCFHLNGGYHVLWLIILYVAGGIIKISSVFATVHTLTLIIIRLFLQITVYVLFLQSESANLLSYISPFIVLNATIDLILFSRLTIPSKMHFFLGLASDATLDAYFLHSSWYIATRIGLGQYAPLATKPWYHMIITVYGSCIIFFLFSIPASQIRRILLKPIIRLAQRIESFLLLKT